MLTSICHRCLSHLRPFSTKTIRLSASTKRMVSSNSAAYDGDGKTTVRILNHEEPHVNMINTYSARGFRLQNNLFIRGSILMFPTHVYSWNVKRGVDITPESLMVFDIIVPKIKIVVIGYGQKGEPYDATLPIYLKEKGMSCELLPTENAVTTYNYLVADSVHVAGAFVPLIDDVVMENKDVQALFTKRYYENDDPYIRHTPQDDPPLESDYKLTKKYRGGFKEKKTFDGE